MSIAVSPPYMGVGFVVVWVLMFVAFYVHEYRSEREDEGAAALVLATSVMITVALLAGLIVAVSWVTQAYIPVFG